MQAYLGKTTVCDFIGELSNATAASILLRGVIGEKLIAVRRFTRMVSPDSCSQSIHATPKRCARFSESRST